jgi:hypothetical protein
LKDEEGRVNPSLVVANELLNANSNVARERAGKVV